MKEVNNLKVKPIKQENNLVHDLNSTLQIQAARITSLLEENEKLGCEVEELKAQLSPLLSILNCSSEKAEKEIQALIEWKKLAQEKLASSLDTARKQADLLWEHQKELNTPTHRWVSYLVKKSETTFPSLAGKFQGKK